MFDELMRKPDVMAFAHLGSTQLDQAVRDGRFPRPIHVTEGGRRIAWLRSEVEAHIQKRIAARNASRRPD